MIKWIISLLLLLTLSFSAFADDSQNTFLARLTTHSMDVTGNSDVYTIKYDQTIFANGISYNNDTGHFKLSESGTYVVTWSFPVGNLNKLNTTGAAWLYANGTKLRKTIYLTRI